MTEVAAHCVFLCALSAVIASDACSLPPGGQTPKPIAEMPPKALLGYNGPFRVCQRHLESNQVEGICFRLFLKVRRKPPRKPLDRKDRGTVALFLRRFLLRQRLGCQATST